MLNKQYYLLKKKKKTFNETIYSKKDPLHYFPFLYILYNTYLFLLCIEGKVVIIKAQ